MQRPLLKPDFTRSIVNLSATLAEYLGCPNEKPTLPLLAEELKKGYRNVVLVILDGMGMHPIARNLPDSCFFVRNMRQVLTSVFPSTTANATTSILTNRYPMEHGWFGWSLYFEELGRAVDLFPEVDSFTGEPIEAGYVTRTLPVEAFYKQAKGFETAAVVPEYWHTDMQNRIVVHTREEMYAQIAELCGRPGKRFVYVYCAEPDSTMHRYGVTSPETQTMLCTLNDGFAALSETLSDTLLILSADHGQIDVEGTYDLYLDAEISAMLQWPAYLEAGAAAFKVKPGAKDDFVRLFTQRYGADFALFSVEKMVREGYFGGEPIEAHVRLLGDFIAVGKAHKIMRLTPRSHPFKGHHTSLTEEMLVPLIWVGKQR